MTYSDEVWCSSIILELTMCVAPEVTSAKMFLTFFKIKNTKTKPEPQDLNLHFPCSDRKRREGNLNRNLTLAFYSVILLQNRTLTKENLKNL